MLNKFGDGLYESFSLAVARNYLGLDLDPVIDDSDPDYPILEGLDLGVVAVILDHQASVNVPYQGPSGSYRYISAEDILDRTVSNPEDLEGVIALVGTSAAGLVDLRATPVQSVYPGVEVHASVIAGIMDGLLQKPTRMGARRRNRTAGYSRGSNGIPASLPVCILDDRGNPGCGHADSNGQFVSLGKIQFRLPLANSMILVFMVYVFNIIYGFFSETRSRMELRSTFGMYVPPRIVDEMKGKTGNELLASERRDMTVLFADIRGFTSISESLDPEELTQFMNTFLTPLTETIHHHRGAIDKYMGDAIMAFWGAPLEDPDHALHGVTAALQMLVKVQELNEDFAARGWPRIKIGIGLASGPMSVGNMGSEFRMAYTVLGDTVNVEPGWRA